MSKSSFLLSHNDTSKLPTLLYQELHSLFTNISCLSPEQNADESLLKVNKIEVYQILDPISKKFAGEGLPLMNIILYSECDESGCYCGDSSNKPEPLQSQSVASEGFIKQQCGLADHFVSARYL